MNDSSFNIIKIAAPVLALVGFVLLCLAGLTDLGQTKTFRFILGEVAAVTAIAYSFLTARGVGTFVPFSVGIWFTVASLNFAQAAWLVTR